MESHLLQMRGLKPQDKPCAQPLEKSHLLQMRGLKHNSAATGTGTKQVASFTDAWIETNKP